MYLFQTPRAVAGSTLAWDGSLTLGKADQFKRTNEKETSFTYSLKP